MSKLGWFDPSKATNIVRDWNKLQGFSSATDEHIMIRRDINVRHVSIENSSERPVGVAITTYMGGPLPPRQFILQGGEVKDIGINSIGQAMQYIHLLDLETKLHVGMPQPLRTDCQSFVLRDGLNGWFIHNFKKSCFTPAH
jgi:hypothetical protein